MKKNQCKYCASEVVIVPFDKKEAAIYAEHLRHRQENGWKR